jgi:ankyrin repeat protein
MSSQREQAVAAIRSGSVPDLDRLIASDVSIAGGRDESGVSLVLLACYHRRPEMVERLLAAGPPLDVFDVAALPGLVDRGRQLLDAGPELTGTYSADGFTALHLASYFDRPEMARLLLERGADANAVSRNAMSLRPLHSAAASRSLEMVRLLLDHGAQADVKQHGGWTPLHSAAAHGDVAMIELLLNRGADPAPTADDGRTPRDMAAEKGHDGAVRLLTGHAARSESA